MRRRRFTVEHRFAIIKYRIFGCPCSGYVLSHLSMAAFNPIIYV
jgi:hypothetical protein